MLLRIEYSSNAIDQRLAPVLGQEITLTVESIQMIPNLESRVLGTHNDTHTITFDPMERKKDSNSGAYH